MQTVMTRGVSVHLAYAVVVGGEPLVLSFFDRSEMAVRGFSANVGMQDFSIYEENRIVRSFAPSEGAARYHARVPNGRESVYHGVCVSQSVNERYILTNEERKREDVFAHLMNHFNLPLLRDWVPYIMESTNELKEVEVELYGDAGEWDGLVVYSCGMTEDGLRELVSRGLKSKRIWISKKRQRELIFDNMDDYFKKYGHTLVENLKKKLNPLVPLKEKVDELAFLKRRLYPQQAAIVNGLCACLEVGSYAFVNEDMGCGKTLQSMGVVDAFFNRRYLMENPEKTVRDVYSDPKAVTYRTVVMCPPHLVEKWVASIKEDVPYAKITVIRGLAELIALRKRGKTRTAREYYVMSKDTGKLSYSYMPLPSQLKTREVRRSVCDVCGENRPLNPRIPCSCGSRNWRMVSEGYKERGLVCPECGELLFPAVENLRLGEELENGHEPLIANDFRTQTSENHQCRHCGSALWMPSCAPVDDRAFFMERKAKKPKWVKVNHFANKAKKGRKTVWVPKNNVDSYIASNGLDVGEVSYPEVYGPRRYAPSRYIKKFLRGFFDMAFFDEAHQLKGGASAQGLSMHDLVKATDKQLVLTGTIAGGYASHLFYLLYRLDPKRMKEKGFEYGSSGEKRFVELYGTTESEYEALEVGEYNATTRGRMLGTPKCKPGISPMIFSEFLLDRAVFLNLSDMSDFLPPLVEKVEFVELEEEIRYEYNYVRDTLKKRMKEKLGKTLLGSFLQYSLSYSDKPYGRLPIRSPVDGSVVAECKDLSGLIKDGKLLNKERFLVELVNGELGEDRNVFVYCDFTGDGETNVAYRLQEVIGDNCPLAAGKVTVLESAYPPAAKREDWMHQKAAEGTRVFVTNPKCVSTGLDFCFEYDGRTYNFPTIVFYQTGYDMFTVWQASRRHYRLNQKVECRTFYLVSKGTIQPAAVELVASKQVATSAIQGQFSSEGLSAMANGVDARIKLAQAVADQSERQVEGLKGMFDVINQGSAVRGEEGGRKPMPTFYELTNTREDAEVLTKEAAGSGGLDILSILNLGGGSQMRSNLDKSEEDVENRNNEKGEKFKEPMEKEPQGRKKTGTDPLLVLLGFAS